jgi:CRISPR/Cas system-associated exonuclease Cas4 (RecB family)
MIMPANLSHLSQSSLQDYADCQRRFQLRYLDRLAYPAEESEPALENERHMQEGEYFHRLVQQHLLGIPAAQIARLANTPDLARWWQDFSNDKDLRDFLSLKDLRTYPESSLSAPLGSLRLLAKYDLIAGAPAGKFIIYDWKTYRKRPRNEWLASRLQTRVYRALLAKAGSQLNGGKLIAPEQIEMIYWFADFPSEPARFPYNATQFRRDWETLSKLAEEISSRQDFPLTEDVSRCLFCPYRSYCNRGVRAGDGEELEAELPPEDLTLEQVQEIEF